MNGFKSFNKEVKKTVKKKSTPKKAVKKDDRTRKK